MTNPRAAQLVEAGMWLRLSGDHEGAKRLFDQALKLDPENAKARQLLDAGNAPPPSAPPPPSEPSNPFAAPPTSTAMDLDWGSATGFAPTPIPFIPPVDFKPPAPTVPNVAQKDDFELPVELDIEAVPPPVFGDDSPSGTLVFGLGGQSEEVPPPAPTAPESWGTASASSPTMMFQEPSNAAGPTEEVPWAAVSFEDEDEPEAPSTMQFARPSEPSGTVPPSVAPAVGGTMQFARPGEQVPPPVASPQPGGGTMQFARPGESQSSEGGTMQFARPGESTPVSTGTMQFAQPQALTDDHNWGEVMSSPSSVFPMPVAAPPPSEPKFAPNATSAWDMRSNPGIKLSEVAPGLGAALDLVSADRPNLTPPPQKSKLDEVRTLLRGAKDLLGLDDHTGAMDLILKAQELAPSDPEVQALRTRSENTLEAMFESKLGKLSSAPRVKLKDDEIIWLNLDHRAGFVLAQIDGQVTFEDLFSVSGMSRLDTARILAQLIEEGVITS